MKRVLRWGSSPTTSFAAITSDAATAAALKAAYGDVNNVELWIGGLAENHLPGAMVGRTFDLMDQPAVPEPA